MLRNAEDEEEDAMKKMMNSYECDDELDECFQRVWVWEICVSEKWKEKWLLVPIYAMSQPM